MKPPSKAGVQSEEQTAADMPSGCPEELCQPLLNLPLTSAGSGFEERKEQQHRLGYRGYRHAQREKTKLSGEPAPGVNTAWCCGSVMHLKNKYLYLFVSSYRDGFQCFHLRLLPQ